MTHARPRLSSMEGYEPTAEAISGFFADAPRAAAIPKVYPAYIGFQIKAALKSLAEKGDPKLDGPIIASVGELETIGDCRYAVEVKDFNGTSYRVTVEVA